MKMRMIYGEDYEAAIDWTFHRSQGGHCPVCLCAWGPWWAAPPADIEDARRHCLADPCPVCGDWVKFAGEDKLDGEEWMPFERRRRIHCGLAAVRPILPALAYLAERGLDRTYEGLVRAVVRDALGEGS